MTFFDLYARKARAQGLIVAGLWLSVLPVAAQDKFIAADTTYTATAMNTMSSHYTITPAAGVPANWKSPVDYTTATVSVRMEVLEKPSAAKTLVNICFEGNVETCMNYPPAYTGTGVINFSQSITTFWQYSMFDYTKGIQSVAVSLKDDKEGFVQGNADFYPTKVKLTVTVTAAAGATGTNDDDAGPPRDAGTRPPRMDAGMMPVGPAMPVDAGVSPTAPANPVGAAAGSGVGVMTPAAAGTTAATAGTTAAGTSAIATGGSTAGDAGPGIRRVSDYLESDTGCSTTRGGNAGSLWLFAGLACWLGWRSRSRRR